MHARQLLRESNLNCCGQEFSGVVGCLTVQCILRGLNTMHAAIATADEPAIVH